VVAPRPFQAAGLLAALARSYPSCRLLAVNLGGNTVVSASPERLAAVSGDRLRCDALGGTIGRSDHPGRDRGLSDALLNGGKARHEHALVVESIREVLRPLCEGLHIPLRPGVSRLRNLQHLKTRIEGRLRPGTSLLDVAGRLHPTAAVGGRPSGAALWWLRQHEGLQRGWYSGGFGWLDANGDGELSVMLRCAVLHGREAELFAGAGIVAGSDPAAEWRETEVKMQAMLAAMSAPDDAVGCSLSAVAQR
jgi:isochorismate synthase